MSETRRPEMLDRKHFNKLALAIATAGSVKQTTLATFTTGDLVLLVEHAQAQQDEITRLHEALKAVVLSVAKVPFATDWVVMKESTYERARKALDTEATS